jgi:uncharacterized protein YqhQ
MSSSPPLRFGGQALVEGVMIQGRQAWSMAVRCPDGSIAVESHPLRAISGWSTWPLVRGPGLLARQARIGWGALNASTQYAAYGERRPLPPWAFPLQLGIALTIVLVVFVGLPMVVTDRPHADVGWAHRLAEGMLRGSLFVGYVALITRLPQLRRLFSYHGAEHMAVHAHEADEPLTVSSVSRFNPAHPRCGTAFLLILILIDTVILAVLPRFGMAPDLVIRLAGLPVVAAFAYEVLRWGAARRGAGAFLTRLGLYTQRLTTARPATDQIEVAIAAVKACRAAEANAISESATDGRVVKRPAPQVVRA